MTIRVAELVGDAKALGVISMSLYDTKHVYIISVSCEEINAPRRTANYLINATEYGCCNVLSSQII